MSNMWNENNKVIRFGNKFTDLMILQIVTILCSLPIITAGAASAAMHDVLLKIYRRQEPYVLKTFFQSFRSNFRKATLIWLCYLGFFLFLAVDLYIFISSTDPYLKMAVYALPVPAILGVLSMCWVFPLQSRYENPLPRTVKHTFLLTAKYPLRTLSMAVLMTIPIWVGYLSSYAAPFLILLGISVPGYLRAIVYSEIFDQLEGADWRREQAESQS